MEFTSYSKVCRLCSCAPGRAGCAPFRSAAVLNANIDRRTRISAVSFYYLSRCVLKKGPPHELAGLPEKKNGWLHPPFPCSFSIAPRHNPATTPVLGLRSSCTVPGGRTPAAPGWCMGGSWPRSSLRLRGEVDLAGTRLLHHRCAKPAVRWRREGSKR